MNSQSRLCNKTTCPYCGVGCGVDVKVDGPRNISVQGSKEHPANQGRLCVKGSALDQTVGIQNRLLYPEVDGHRASWDHALATVASRLNKLIEAHGPDSVSFYLSGQLLTEDYYVANKLMKGFIGTANVDTNSRLCMASAVAGYKRAFGTDTVPCDYRDLETCDLLIMIGSNAAWTHPVLFQRICAARAQRPDMQLVVIDPRQTATSEMADLHLQLAPGSDAFLFNGLLRYLVKNGHWNPEYVARFCGGLDATLAEAEDCGLEAVAEATGLNESELLKFYRLFAGNRRVVSFYSQGINQSATGTDKCNAIINCHLVTGKLGKPGSGPFSITGQPNAMGGREVGGLANQLAAHMEFDESDVDRVARFWRAPNIARKPGLKAIDLFDAIEAGKVKAVWIMATNPAVSLPDSDRIRRALDRCELVIVSDCNRDTDTNRLADILLPATPWGEKDGTVTNSERRISRQRAFFPPAGEARHDWQIICDIARRLGHGDAFTYSSPRDIFIEHAALSGFENAGHRAFDISALQHLSELQYDELEPVQWPIARANPRGSQRLFDNGLFFTGDTKARLVPVTARLPDMESATNSSLVLNTGRIRDQWHTMTRTGQVPKLMRHVNGPFAALNPVDADRLGICEGSLIEISNDNGAVTLPAKPDTSMVSGQVFVPIHWSDQFSSNARVSSLLPSRVDPWSGQPESKFAVVKLQPVHVHQWVSLTTSLPVSREHFAYWHKYPAGDSTQLLAALTRTGPEPGSMVKSLSASLRAPELVEYEDAINGDYRCLLFDSDKRLVLMLFASACPEELPDQDWCISQLNTTHNGNSWLLLAGKDFQKEDQGALVCSCFEVGVNAIRRAIEGGARDPAQLGRELQCGTNCGSCIPELIKLIGEFDTVTVEAAAM